MKKIKEEYEEAEKRLENAEKSWKRPRKSWKRLKKKGDADLSARSKKLVDLALSEVVYSSGSPA